MPRNRNSNSNAKLESDLGDAPLRAKATSRFNAPVRLVFTHYRRRLIDTDNLCVKAVVDSLRRANLFPDDSPEWISEITHRQVKATEEKTVIKIEEI